MQTRYHLAYREEEREVLPLCADQGVGVLPYSPLARGLLARRQPGEAPPTPRAAAEAADRSEQDDGQNDADIVAALHAVAAQHARPPAQVALAWLLAKPTVTAPIVGITRPEHLDDIRAALDLHLSPTDTATLEAPYRPHTPYGYPMPGRGNGS